jgi:putative transposase
MATVTPVRILPVTRIPLRRFYGRGDLHFLTFSCYRRRPFLGTVRARNVFVRTLDAVRRAYSFRLFGYVVMPEHVHQLISEPNKSTPSSVLQVLKQKVSRALRQRERKRVPGQLHLAFDKEESASPAFWQRRFYDFNVWSTKKIFEKLEYMHENPVKRKTGAASERLAVEQLVALREARTWTSRENRKENPHP